MTETTDSRQIRTLVQGVLNKHGIDNLLLEIDLSEAFKRYFMERRKSGDKAGIRTKILSDMQAAAVKVQKNEAMESRVKQATGLTVNDRWYRDGVMDFLLERDEAGQTIEEFAAACEGDPYQMPKMFQIAKEPAFLMDTWGLAFKSKQAGYNPMGLSVQ